ncbi:outer membrane beta-barrel family protein [Saccharicrinis fermentans]|uniref:Outer membrane protein beta-barrel domain-containing protein n=1 Tax=Saccharicrinis fermentans DSM 9555 = JCM 21142 TaxID=869213 RepID=W7YTD3_9BACT|nr:outer membrane beta-barrel family protein [Saccharicrinis fermentans]GAF05699.1 hypothetical protein JCM21142_104446 [Saccharicrinis fermentans DSM 9555 = JCM 21142]
MEKYNLIFLLLLINNINTIAQKVHLKGDVVDTQNIPIDYFTVALLNNSDSSIITGGAYLNGKFNIEHNDTNSCIIQISSVGYQQILQLIQINNSLNLGTFKMNGLDIEEVVVAARKPKIKQKEGRTIISVEGTALEELGNSIDVLKNTPAVQVNNDGKISIFGKGSPLIIIDGREISSTHELDILQSSNIKTIEVDKSPSVATKSDVSSVIKITTKNKSNFSAELYNRSYFGRKFSNKTGINIVQPYEKIRNIISYSFYKNNKEYYNDDYDINNRSDYQIQNTTYSKNYPSSSSHNFLTGIEYDHDSTNTTRILYHFNGYNEDFSKFTLQQIIKSNSPDTVHREISLNTIEKTYQHNISINHTKSFSPSSSLYVSTDYAKVVGKENTNIKEATTNLINTQNKNKDDYNVFTFNSHYNNGLNENTSINAGLRAAFINNNGTTSSVNLDEEQINYWDKQTTKDLVSAIYFSYNHSKNKVDYEFGLRAEHTNTHANLNEMVIIDSSYIHVFPSLLASYSPSNKFGISMHYNHKIERPYFSDLNPTQTYYDSLSYRQGNPFLKPTIKKNLALNVELPWGLSLSSEYTRYTNMIVLAATNDSENPDIIKYTPINIDESERILLGLIKAYDGKIHSYSISGGIEFPFIKIPYLGETKQVRTNSWYLSINNDISIGNKIMLYSSFDYYSKSVDAITTYDSYYNLWASASLKLLDKQLVISLDMDNILNSNNINWEDNYEYITNGGKNDFDNRIVRISVKYTFKNFKDIFNTDSNNSQELDRL